MDAGAGIHGDFRIAPGLVEGAVGNGVGDQLVAAGVEVGRHRDFHLVPSVAGAPVAHLGSALLLGLVDEDFYFHAVNRSAGGGANHAANDDWGAFTHSCGPAGDGCGGGQGNRFHRAAVLDGWRRLAGLGKVGSSVRRPGAGGFEGYPAQAVEGDFRPLVGLIGRDHLFPRTGGNGPAGNHPGRQANGAGQQDEGAAEVAAGALKPLEKKPIHRVVSRGRPVVGRSGEGIGVTAPKVSFDGLGLQVGAAGSLGNFPGQLSDALRQVVGQLGVERISDNRRSFQLLLGEPRSQRGVGQGGHRRFEVEYRRQGEIFSVACHRFQVRRDWHGAGRDCAAGPGRNGNAVGENFLGGAGVPHHPGRVLSHQLRQFRVRSQGGGDAGPPQVGHHQRVDGLPSPVLVHVAGGGAEIVGVGRAGDLEDRGGRCPRCLSGGGAGGHAHQPAAVVGNYPAVFQACEGSSRARQRLGCGRHRLGRRAGEKLGHRFRAAGFQQGGNGPQGVVADRGIVIAAGQGVYQPFPGLVLAQHHAQDGIRRAGTSVPAIAPVAHLFQKRFQVGQVFESRSFQVGDQGL